jgi:hypothetical protein
MVKGLEKLFVNDEMKNAYIWVLLPFVITYNKEKLVVPSSFKKAFEETAEEYDIFKNALFDAYEAKPDSRVPKDELTEYFKTKLGAAWAWPRILRELKSLGYTYVRDARFQGAKGVVFGLVQMPSKCKIEIEEPVEVGRYYPFEEIGLGLGGRPILKKSPALSIS